MTDLTKIEKPFGLLDKETRDALRRHYADGGMCEFLRASGEWSYVRKSFGLHGIVYRAKPASPLTVRDWSMISDEVVAVARDEDGAVWTYAERPVPGSNQWVSMAKIGQVPQSIIGHGLLIEPGTCGWKKAIAIRPGHEE